MTTLSKNDFMNNKIAHSIYFLCMNVKEYNNKLHITLLDHSSEHSNQKREKLCGCGGDVIIINSS